jgi:hypothetical protein
MAPPNPVAITMNRPRTTGKPRSGIDIALHPAQSQFMKGSYDASRSTTQASDQHPISALLLQQVLEVGEQPKGRLPGVDDVGDTPTLGLAFVEDVVTWVPLKRSKSTKRPSAGVSAWARISN